MTSYRALDKLVRTIPVEEHGVRMRMANFFFEKNINEMPDQLEKMLEIASVKDVSANILDQMFMF
jgi:D-amino-acid oxidase